MKKSIWFDFENAPHVWVLKELIAQFERDGWRVVITARDFSSTLGLCKHLGLPAIPIGENNPAKSKWQKMTAVLQRGKLLQRYIRQQGLKPLFAVSHGSRSQAFAASLLRIPSFSLDDYEYSFGGFNYFVKNILTPFAVKKESWGIFRRKVVQYPGLKEELYLWNKTNIEDKNIACIKHDSINVVFRPEGRATHYSTKLSRMLQDEVVELFARQKNVHVVLISRDKMQEQYLIEQFNKKGISFSVPDTVLNGPALIAHSDLVIGGGGTMTREACALGIPSYSFFGGTQGGVDAYLERDGRLIMLRSKVDIEKIQFSKKDDDVPPFISKDAFNFVYHYLRGVIQE